ncbi:MAG: CapA family protein [Cyanobacteria bacterium SID2]|nr:CapA family protein [Cyanobacteria bacterium SID2]MBP0002174.1 CapA family protein [Cyanobacteria bacterium SBC]
MIAEVGLQPSLVELARAGNFHAIAYWINRHLIPEGIYARVGAASAGCVQIQVEVPPLPMDTLWQQRIVRAICHYIWKLNSDVIQGVQIVAHLAGKTEILWKRSVRIVTPANQQRRRTPRNYRHLWHSLKHWIARSYKSLRLLLLAGTAAAAFSLGCWLSYHDLPPLLPKLPPLTSTTSIEPPSKPLDRIQSALEEISIERQTPQYPHRSTVRLTFGGDVDLSGFADDADALSDLDAFQTADVATLNLDLPLTDADTPRPKADNRKAHPEAVAHLTEAGIDVVNLANDRVMDYHVLGLDETLTTLDRAGIHHIGAGRGPTEARRPKILEIKGQRIAYFGYTLGDLYTARPGRPGTNSGEETHIARDIQAIRDRVDWVIVNFHWGAELASYPTAWQTDLARFAIDNGADLIVGHHPRTLQGAEIYRNRPIIYALGDLTSGESAAALLNVSLTKRDMTIDWLPVDTSGDRPVPATGEIRREILDRLEAVSQRFDRPLPRSASFNKRERPVSTSTVESEPLPELSWPLDRSLPILPSAHTENNDSFVPDSFITPAGTEHPEPPRAGKNAYKSSFPNAKPADSSTGESFIFSPFVEPAEDFSEMESNESDNSEEAAEPMSFLKLRLPFEPSDNPSAFVACRSSHAEIELPSIS